MELTLVVLVALTIGLVEVIKRINIIQERFLPAISLIMGSILYVSLNGISVKTLIIGIAIGLSSSGLFDIGKKTILGK